MCCLFNEKTDISFTIRKCTFNRRTCTYLHNHRDFLSQEYNITKLLSVASS